MTTKNPTLRRGFTLIELLTVIAIIGLLAGILIPTTGVVLNKVSEARSKNTFSSYATALVSYRQDFGIFPPFGANPFGVEGNQDDFHIALSGKDASGASPASRALNRTLTEYYNFSENDYNDATGLIADAFGNSAIFLQVEPTKGAGIASGNYPTDAKVFTASAAGDTLGQPAIIWSVGTGPSSPTIRSWD